MYFYIIYESPISVIVVLQCCHIFQKIQKSRKSTKTIQQSAATFVPLKKNANSNYMYMYYWLANKKIGTGFSSHHHGVNKCWICKMKCYNDSLKPCSYRHNIKKCKIIYNVTYLHFIHFPWLLWFDILVWWSSKIYIYLPICHSVYKYAQLCTDQGFGHIPVYE